jgi:hypothetical protein
VTELRGEEEDGCGGGRDGGGGAGGYNEVEISNDVTGYGGHTIVEGQGRERRCC